ncbi:hypothetical protein E2562_010516 [Oryza meyeriana var. granulata]|uniref:Late embryogenesis abundant protein LEA-2 subgroup domain-containing protein n=1 Tax=Oryza meyeriana var. granulata TaxID=110450 RepID=A0A6G1DUZ2_9ORYZ|nr:hypothetical protein E2562_010516 [Oryza meyeriana var. granulata]
MDGGDFSDQPQPSRKYMLVCFLVVVFFFCPLMAFIYWEKYLHQDPVFSVSLTEVAGGLDLARSPVIRPDFGLTLRVDNQQIARTCREEVTVTVFYDDTVVGWADVPDFCVDNWTTAQLEVPLSHADVVLTYEQRRRLASQLRSGNLELTVETRMVFPEGFDRECDNSASRQSLLLCQVTLGQGYMYCPGHLLQDRFHNSY